MKTSIYAKLQKKIVLITLLVSFTPLLLLGIIIYHQFSKMHTNKIIEQIRYRSQAQAESIDLFLKERSAILSAMADTHSFQYMKDENHLSEIFHVMNTRAGAFVDLGVIDSRGEQLAYVGPYSLEGLNYNDQPWFGEVISKGIYISDVYMGYRRIPHFIIAVRRQEKQQSWILRATIDPGIFGRIVRAAKLGKTGDAFIINGEGVYQTSPRFHGEILWSTRLNGRMFGGGTTVLEQTDENGRKLLYAGSRLKNKEWILVIRQDAAEEMESLFATRNIEIAIILSGLLAIILATIFTTRLAVNRLKESDAKMNELNAKLAHSDKLAALGKMSASVAHEINNPLNNLIQRIGWIEDLLEEEDLQETKNIEEYKTSLQKVVHHSQRIKKVVHSMLGYARKMEPRLEQVDINDILNQTIDFLENYARINNIGIQTDLGKDLPTITSDGSKLQQVLLNLISNAIDAIGKDGLIEVKSRKTDTHITVDVTDNGPGISKDQQKKIFSPFFTTKLDGKGTGLGLWVSYDIMEKMGGTIYLKSDVEVGTTFTVHIPLVVPEEE
ncbi:MAG: ATP-binding protein [Pseudomonadota bacterium]